MSSDNRSVEIEFMPTFLTPSKVVIGGTEYTRIGFVNRSSGNLQNAGAPELSEQSVLVRLPGVGQNHVEVLNASYEDLPGIFLPPTPAVHKTSLGPVLSYEPDPTAYSKKEFLPAEIASLTDVRNMRGEITGNLRIVPYQYDAGDRIVRKFNRIVVRITYGSPSPRLKTKAIPHATQELAINSDDFESNVVMGRQAAGLHSSVLSSGPWFRFSVVEDGMYKLTGQTLLAAGIPASTDPHTIRIFGNGGFETPLAATAQAVDDLVENAVDVFDGGTANALDPSDYIVFYGKGTRGWTYSPGDKSFHHYLNHYTETNVYWLTYGGVQSKAISLQGSLNVASPFRPSTVAGMLFREDDKINLFATGIEWLGQSFNPGGQIGYTHSLFGCDVSQPLTYQFAAGALAASSSTFSMYEHGVFLTYLGTGPTGGDYPPLKYGTSSATFNPASIGNFNNQSQLQIRYNTSDAYGVGYLDWYEILYHRFLRAQGDVFDFHSHDTDASAEYTISGLTGPAEVFDVASFDSVVRITNPRMSADTCTFQVQLGSGSADEFFVVGPSGFKTPGALTVVSNENLHRADTVQATYIIVTHPDFMQAAQRLASYRQGAANGSLRSLVVDINQIYNEFGGGLPTPVAVRNFLRYAYSNWTLPPKYVLLLGDGDYDYRRILGESTPNWIPPWETPESFNELASYADEDAFVTFTSSGRVDSIGLGRLTVRSLSEANAVVDKIIEYETNPVRDPWRLRCTFVADDDLGGLIDNPPHLALEGLSHTRDAEAAASFVPALFEKRKIYSYEYPTVYTSIGRAKPTVNKAIDDQINQGTLTLNFNGHGNPRLWTHEEIFVRESDFPLLHNKGKYFFLIAATCNYSDFDMVDDQSGGELLVSMPNAGAIAVFSANRPVFEAENAALNQLLNQNLFQSDSLNRIRPQRLGDVVFRTKRSVSGGDLSNDIKYFLLGDPALMMGFPQLNASVDSINGSPSSQVVQIKALERVSVGASLHDGNAQPNFAGTALVTLYDANQTVTLTGAQGYPSALTYTVPGDVLFRGVSSVSNGAITSRFIVPKDISYRNDFGRIGLYAWSTAVDGAGFTTNLRFSGVDSTAPLYTKGPLIKLFIDGRGFRPGDVVSGSPVLIADLFDSSGINTSGAGIGHRLEAWLDDSPQSVDLSPYYRSKLDTYQEGTIEYPLGSLAAGSHRLRVRAWDVYDNSSTEETVFDVMSGVGLQLSNVFNYPNPFSSSTLFTFEHNQVSTIDAEVKIYTVAGRLIQSLRTTNVDTRLVRIPWDGRDKDGDVIANGIYLYKVVARTSDGRLTSEAFGKLSIAK